MEKIVTKTKMQEVRIYKYRCIDGCEYDTISEATNHELVIKVQRKEEARIQLRDQSSSFFMDSFLGIDTYSVWYYLKNDQDLHLFNQVYYETFDHTTLAKELDISLITYPIGVGVIVQDKGYDSNFYFVTADTFIANFNDFIETFTKRKGE